MKFEAGPVKVEASEGEINALGKYGLPIASAICLALGAVGLFMGRPALRCGALIGAGVLGGSAWAICKGANITRRNFDDEVVEKEPWYAEARRQREKMEKACCAT